MNQGFPQGSNPQRPMPMQQGVPRPPMNRPPSQPLPQQQGHQARGPYPPQPGQNYPGPPVGMASRPLQPGMPVPVGPTPSFPPSSGMQRPVQPLPHHQSGVPPQYHQEAPHPNVPQIQTGMANLNVGDRRPSANQKSPLELSAGKRAQRVYQQPALPQPPRPPLSERPPGPTTYSQAAGGMPPQPQPGRPLPPQYQMQQPMAPAPSIPGTGPMQQPPQTKPKSKIDPDQIPSPLTVHEADQKQYDQYPFYTSARQLPPQASTVTQILDEGNCGPNFVRSTLYSVPHSEDLQSMSGIPFGLVIQPLAEPGSMDRPIPLIDFGEMGPPRCRRCRAFINPNVTFIDGGRSFMCNLCGCETEVPGEYFCNLDMNGKRTDLHTRPELQRGSVEFVATKEYILRPPNPASIVFALEVSYGAVQCGMVERFSESLLDILYGGNDTLPTGVRIGIITFDKSVHFYNLKSSLDQAQMMVVPDVQEIFVPLNEGFLVDPYESRNVIEGLLSSLPSMFRNSRITESAMGASAQSAFMALSNLGGKLIIFQASIPSFGPGGVRNREEPKIFGTDKEKTLFTFQNDFYKSLSADCARKGVCVDMFLFPSTYIDIATIGTLCEVTGGKTYLFQRFDPNKDAIALKEQLRKVLFRNAGFEAVLRIRSSNGLRIGDHYGNFHMENATDVEFAGIDSSTTFAAEVKYEGNLDEKYEAGFQCVILYTTYSGQRRIRVHNLSLQVTSLLGDVFRYADVDTTINFLAKQVVTQAPAVALRSLRDKLTETCVKVLCSYRRNCAASTSSGQLILPESFKLFPLYTMGLIKNKAIRGGTDLSSDIRVHMMRTIKSINVKGSMQMVYPKMIQLTNLGEEVGMIKENGRFVYPQFIRCSIDRLRPDGAYLIYNGLEMCLWIGQHAGPNLGSLFGVNSPESVDVSKPFLPVLDSPDSERARKLIEHIQSQSEFISTLKIVRQHMDPSELQFVNMALEDLNNESMSYVDYLCFIHRQVQAEVSNDD